MSVRVAKLFVSVALSIGAFPALASSSSEAGKHADTTAHQASSDRLYWTASSEYYNSPSTGVHYASAGQNRRRVLISGYHPYEGFEDAVAQEAENAARHR